MDDSLPNWFDEDFPPLAIYYGGRDYLVATEPLLERLRECEKSVKLIRVQKLATSEVCVCSDASLRMSSTERRLFLALRFLPCG